MNITQSYSTLQHCDNEWPDGFFNTHINITSHVSLSCRIIERYEAKNVIRKLFPQPGETSLANALRSALRPGEFKMTSMGR